ncbi:MAG: hypothetical protein ABEL76_10960 [Bradymonadaceae bacterium]
MSESPHVPPRSPGRAPIVLAGLVVWLLVLGSGCAASNAGREEPSPEVERSGSADRGGETGPPAADPMGTARGWIERALERDEPVAGELDLSAWTEPVVERLYRAEDGAYRAVIGDVAGADRAVLLAIEPASGSSTGDGDPGWQVTAVSITDPSHLWPRY